MSASESKPVHSRLMFPAEIDGKKRQKRLSRHELDQPFRIDSGAIIHVNFINY